MHCEDRSIFISGIVGEPFGDLEHDSAVHRNQDYHVSKHVGDHR
jgi:hypothetical protein